MASLALCLPFSLDSTPDIVVNPRQAKASNDWSPWVEHAGRKLHRVVL